jgi:hypothetical protein
VKPLVYTYQDWNPIWQKIKRDHPPSVYLIRSNMKKVLGFTVREHQQFDSDKDMRVVIVMLDFYSEKHRSLFLLKYGNI